MKKDGLGGAEWIDRSGVPPTDSWIFEFVDLVGNKKATLKRMALVVLSGFDRSGVPPTDSRIFEFVDLVGNKKATLEEGWLGWC
ncbi:hypothetical protein SAMN05421640_0622 [Ekhidna lutea]|uniref:Uncharacterized protein n=1 Tax=Ekhidna lutea TaxID=447679 RepID=A0A239FFB2_EKHLU|nr:hypothetical protein [Ekhidna lutea]SNS54983.1 hypothetical protein SAMN05421640_0622 [Ekhidna lutea]